MPNICLTIAYDGTHYAGWQVQKNAKTIQAELEKALRKILKEKITLIGSGRTDSGVHARAQIANFKTKRTGSRPGLELVNALNGNLPEDISIVGAKKVPSKFHSRFDAKGKIYRYTILNSRIDDPFTKNYYHKVRYKLDVPLVKKETKVLIGRHDFKSFQAKSALSKIKNTVRTVKRISVKKEKDLIYIDIEANGFLHNMARNIAGTLIEIGRGYLPAGSMRKILSAGDRTKAGPTAPARGLTLIKVKYR